MQALITKNGDMLLWAWFPPVLSMDSAASARWFADSA